MERSKIEITYPDWLIKGPWWSSRFGTDADKVDLAVQLARTNIEHKGGPFGAGIFDNASGELLAVGTNLVVNQCNSVLHAEIMAIMMAESRLGAYWLARNAERPQGVVLACSCEPCCMCVGAVVASGIEQVLCAATNSDAQAAGFDEGPVFDESWAYLERLGIRVVRGIHRALAADVLSDYRASGGRIYIPNRRAGNDRPDLD